MRTSTLSAAVISLMLLVAACSGTSSTGTGSPSAAASLPTFRLVDFPGDVFFTDVVAQKQGFFAKAGINVQNQSVATGPAALQLLVAGSIDGTLIGSSLPLVAAAQNQDIKIIGTPYGVSAFHIFVSNKAGLAAKATFPQGIQALKGKTIGLVALEGATYLSLKALLANAGVGADQVQLIAVGSPQAALAQMKAGRIDAYSNIQPTGVLLKDANIGYDYLDYAKEAPASIAQVADGAMVVSGKWLTTHQKEAKAWVDATESAVTWIKAHPQQAASLFSATYGGSDSGDSQVVQRLIDTVYPTNLPGLAVPRAAINNQIQSLVDSGDIKSGSVSYAKIVAPSALQGK